MAKFVNSLFDNTQLIAIVDDDGQQVISHHTTVVTIVINFIEHKPNTVFEQT